MKPKKGRQNTERLQFPSQQVVALAKAGQRGWLTPDGDFFEAPEISGEIAGLQLGGHEQAALGWLCDHSPGLFAELNERRLEGEYETWEDTTVDNLIKRFMREKGFERVAADILAPEHLD